MDTKEKHFVLVHGACHGAWCWYKVATLLKSSGHRVTALDMVGAGVHPKRWDEFQSISDYFEPLIEFMSSLTPEEKVILVGHSLGGMCLSVAMEKFPEKISVAVFVTAFIPRPTLSLPTLLHEYYLRLDSQMDNQYTFDQGHHNPPTSFLFGPKFSASKLYQLSPPEALELATMLMRPLALFSDEVLSKETEITVEKYGSVGRVYIVCDEDHAIKEDLQRWMIEKNPTDEVKVITGADHMVMFSKPLELCSCLQDIADNYS